MRIEYLAVGFVLLLIVLAIILGMLGILPNIPAEIEKLVKGL